MKNWTRNSHLSHIILLHTSCVGATLESANLFSITRDDSRSGSSCPPNVRGWHKSLVSPNGGTKMPKHVKRLIPQEFTIDHSSSLKDALIKSQCFSFTSCPSRFCAQVFYPECSKKEEKKTVAKTCLDTPSNYYSFEGRKTKSANDKVVLFTGDLKKRREKRKTFFDTWEIICSYRNKYRAAAADGDSGRRCCCKHFGSSIYSIWRDDTWVMVALNSEHRSGYQKEKKTCRLLLLLYPMPRLHRATQY